MNCIYFISLKCRWSRGMSWGRPCCDGDSPEHGRISPAEFVPLAEGSGDIIRIGEWVVQEFCEC